MSKNNNTVPVIEPCVTDALTEAVVMQKVDSPDNPGVMQKVVNDPLGDPVVGEAASQPEDGGGDVGE